MQETRRHILETFKEKGESTVEELVTALRERTGKITAVTIRYHLDILRDEGLIETARLRRRRSPGRPQYVYTLTEQAQAFFPKNYQALTQHILAEIKRSLPSAQVNVIMESVAQRMAEEVASMPSDLSPQERIAHIADYLSQKGYQASWEPDDETGDYLLHINNCPYHPVATEHTELCLMDAQLITMMLGTAAGCASTIAQGKETCTYKAQLRNQSRSLSR